VLDCGSMLTLSVLDCGFEWRLGQTKDCKICICCFLVKHAAAGWLGNRIMYHIYLWTITSVS